MANVERTTSRLSGKGLLKGKSNSASDPSIDEQFYLEKKYLGPPAKDRRKEKLTRGKKFKRHCKRFWFCYVLAGIILLAVGIPVLLLVVLPAVLQLMVNKTDLPILGGAFLATGADTITVSIRSSLDIPAGIKALLDPVMLYLYNPNSTIFSPFIEVALGETQLDGKTTIDVKDMVVPVTNETELTGWFSKVFDDEKTVLSVRGNTHVHLGTLKMPVALDKTQQITTLNSLKGFGYKEFKVLLPPDADGMNIHGNLTLPNWSQLVIGLGNVTLNVLSGDMHIGLVYLNDVILPPGNNTLPFKGQVFLGKVLDNIKQLITDQSGPLSAGKLRVGASGNTTVWNGVHVGYVEKVLAAKRLEAEMPIIQLGVSMVGGLMSGAGNDKTYEQFRDIFGNLTAAGGKKNEWKDFLGKMNLTSLRKRALDIGSPEWETNLGIVERAFQEHDWEATT